MCVYVCMCVYVRSVCMYVCMYVQYSSFLSWHSCALNTHVFFNFCWVTCMWNACDTQRAARVQYFVHCTQAIFVQWWNCTRVKLHVLHASHSSRVLHTSHNSLIYILYVRTLYARVINYEMAKSMDTQKNHSVKNTCSYLHSNSLWTTLYRFTSISNRLADGRLMKHNQ